MIYIVIPVFNRKEFTRNCLQSLSRQTYRAFETIVVDDGSSDGTSEMIRKEFPAVHVLRGDGNLWWAGATNAGIELVLKNRNWTDADFILTLNNDLELPEQYLELIFYHASVNERSIIGSASVDILNPEHLDFCGIQWNEFTGKYFSIAKRYQFSFAELMKEKEPVLSDMLPGRGTLIPMNVFSEIGLFDSVNFPQYAADEDFALRAKRKGWKLIIPADVFVKSHIMETGIDTSKMPLTHTQFKDLFFSLRSPLNLKIRYRFAMKNTKLKLVYFMIGLARITVSLTRNRITHSIKRLKPVNKQAHSKIFNAPGNEI